MEGLGTIAAIAGFDLDTVDVTAFELCFDINAEGTWLATLLYDGKPRNAFSDALEEDGPVGWCLQFSDQLREGTPVLWCFECDFERLDLATAIACGMVRLRLLQLGWWRPLPDNRLWDATNPDHVRAHVRVMPDPAPASP